MDEHGDRHSVNHSLPVFCSLRWRELAAPLAAAISIWRPGCSRVEASVAELTGSLVTGPPKSAAGRRLISIPAAILPDVTDHLGRYTLPGNDSLVFIGPEERSAAAQQLHPDLDTGHHDDRAYRFPLPRPAPYRKRTGRRDRRKPARTDGPDGS